MTYEFDYTFYLIVKMSLLTSQLETADVAIIVLEPKLLQGNYVAVGDRLLKL